jgi:hypothetical protein
MRSVHSVIAFIVFSCPLALAQNNPVPFIDQPLVPMTAAPGGPAFTLAVNGAGFVSSSVVTWNGNPLTTTFVSDKQLTADVPAANIGTAGTAWVTVASPNPGGGTSNVQFLDVATTVATLAFTPLPAINPEGAAYTIAADFNGEGKLDIAYIIGAAYSSWYLVVQLGNGDGTFQAPVSYVAASGDTFPTALVAGDFNGDGKLDIAVTTENVLGPAFNYQVMLGNGDGTFRPLTPGSLTYFPNSLAVADINGDGKLDLLVTSDLDQGAPYDIGGGVSVLLGNGDATFQTPILYDASNGYGDLVLGDFNGDGNLDFVAVQEVAGSNGAIVSLVYAEGNGNGTFQTAQQIGLDQSSSVLVAADLNGDGKLDFVCADGNGAAVFLGNGNGTFQSPARYGAGLESFSVFVQDFNADGKLDLLLADSSQGSQGTFLLGNGDGSFQSPTGFPSNVAGFPIAAGDFNDDGRFDVVTDANTGSRLYLQGQIPVPILSSYSLTFPQQPPGTTSPRQAVRLTNIGIVPLAISNIGINGTGASSFAQTGNCPASLTVNASCQISVTFTPPTPATGLTAALNITDDAPNSPQSVALTGTTPPFLSPTTVTMPSQYVGTSGLPQAVTLYNTGTTALAISNVTATPSSDFSALSGCGSSLPAGQSCSIGVFFDPSTTGTRTGTLTVTDNATDSPQTSTLTGMGQDFAMNVSSPNATVAPGQTAQYNVAVSPGGGFDQTVALTCAGAPSMASCSVSPSSVKLNGSGATTVSVTVTTAGTMAWSMRPSGAPPTNRLAPWLVFAGLPGLLWAGGRKRYRKALCGLMFVCIFSGAMFWSSCGGGGGSGSSNGGGTGTPAGTYNLTVTGAFSSGSTNLVHSAKLNLVVQ